MASVRAQGAFFAMLKRLLVEARSVRLHVATYSGDVRYEKVEPVPAKRLSLAELEADPSAFSEDAILELTP